MDKVEERKEKVKPQKLFTVNLVIFDDGIVSGFGIEYRNMGRLKNQKLIVPGKEEFESLVRSLVPTALPIIQPVVDVIYKDLEVEDVEGSEKFGKVTIDIYSDSFIDCDFAEIQKGPRGAPKAWRLPAHDFINAIDNRLGHLSKSFKSLLKAGNANILETTAKVHLEDEHPLCIKEEGNDYIQD